MNGSLFEQSSEAVHASICLINCRKNFFFSVTYLEHDFMIANLVRLNLVVLNENIGDLPVVYLWWSAILLKLQPFIPQFNQFHPGCSYHITSLAGYF